VGDSWFVGFVSIVVVRVRSCVGRCGAFVWVVTVLFCDVLCVVFGWLWWLVVGTGWWVVVRCGIWEGVGIRWWFQSWWRGVCVVVVLGLCRGAGLGALGTGLFGCGLVELGVVWVLGELGVVGGGLACG